MDKPPIITNGRLKSQLPDATSKNPATLLTRAIPLINKPAPNVAPTTNSPTKRPILRALGDPRRPTTHRSAPNTKRKHAREAAKIDPTYQAGWFLRIWGGMAEPDWSSVPETRPTPMKTGTATQDLGLRRAKPVRPWPDVQPCCKAAPKPTKKAPKAILRKMLTLSAGPVPGIGSLSVPSKPRDRRKLPTSMPKMKRYLLASGCTTNRFV
mmetsp:Transcript_85021/g.177688  ORF Transcript_85021/g.177688 Transcript_85021/m.177688 type:complete len:210 (+) Transcript_85021:625-1254(+)